MIHFRKLYIVFTAVILIIGAGTQVYSQQPKKSAKFLEQALSAFRQNDLEIAKDYSLKAIERDTLNVKAYLLLSDIAAELKIPAQYQWALNKVISLSPDQYPLAYKLLAESYFSVGDYWKASRFFVDYTRFAIKTDSAYIVDRIEQCKAAELLIENKFDVELIHLNSTINSKEDEYWPFVSADDSTLYFTRLITTEKLYYFERLFFSENTPEGWLPAQKLVIGSNAEVNEGTISMTANGHLIFFTACGRSDGYGSCDIYYMQNKRGEWQAPQNAGNKVNSSNWDAQPAVSSKGEKLYWSSNRNGGIGGRDIWMSSIAYDSQGNISFSSPVNLGRKINSIKNDYSPFIHADDHTLYFASEGHYGLGQSDLFVSHFKDSSWTFAQNLGFPINSCATEDGLVVSPTAHVALFSSNRKGAINESKDLYLFQLPKEFEPNQTGYVKGDVFDAESGEKLDAEIELTNLNSNVKWTIEADDKEGYITTLEAMQNYAFNINKRGYLIYSEHFNLEYPQDFKDATIYNIYLQPIKKDARVVLKNIFFEFNSASLNEKSEVELEQLVDFLKKNQKVKVEISGHTDNVGSSEYNQKLSEQRAKAISVYLEKYIEKGRINYVGYGDRKPVASNDTEAGRSKNRRSELRIVAY